MMHLIIILLSLLFSLEVSASFVFNDNCKQAYTDVMCLRFARADSRMLTERKLNPTNQVPVIIDNYIDFLKVLIGEEDVDFNRLKDMKDIRLQTLARDGKNSPWCLYGQSLIYMQSGIARIKFGEYVSASLEINRAYRLLTENQAKFPEFVMNKVGLGVLHSLIGTVPEKYRWATRSLNFDGTIPEGNMELMAAYQQVINDPQLRFLLPETAILLTFVTVNLSADLPAALNLVESFRSQPLAPIIKESPLLIYACANIYLRAGKNDNAIKIISERPTVDRYPFHYLNFMLGVAKLNRLDKDANYPLLSFLGAFKGKNYIRSAYMHLAWYYLLQNDTKQYAVYLERIKLRGNDQVDNDREALSFANRNVKPDLPLLRARLLSDGGYYARALDELEGYNPAGKKNLLEYSYRQGRIYHNWGKTDEAVKYYKITMANGMDQLYYFAANSALQLGIIYEKRKEFSLARKYFSSVLEMDFDEYQFSISNKAQAGLSRIKGK